MNPVFPLAQWSKFVARAALIAGLAGGSAALFAQTAPAPLADQAIGPVETLADAVAAAYERNPTLVQQRYLQKARDESYVQARSAYGPQVTVQSQATHRHAEQGLNESTTDTGTTTAQLSQTLYSAGRIRGQVDSARATILAGQESLRTIEQQTVQNVVIVYASVLRDTARLEVARENVAVLREQLEQNIVRQRVGDVTLTDQAQAQARLYAAEITLASIESDLAVARGQYLQIVGHNPGTLAPLPDLGAVPPSIDQAFALAETDNPGLLAAKYTEQASSATAASIRGQLGPTVSGTLQGIYTNEAFRFNGVSGQKQFVAGLTVSQPIMAGGAIRSRVREADARNGADQAGIDLARRNALQSVTTAWSQLAASRIALSSGTQQVEAAQQAFAGMRCEELNGLRSTIETLNAEQELQAAQLLLLQNRYQVYVSHAALLASIGALQAQTIAGNVTVYDPEANFKAVRWRGLTPLDLIGMTLDRVGSTGPRRPLSANLTGANVPRPEREGPLPPTPGPELTRRPLVSITASKLRLPDGSTTDCPLSPQGPSR